MKTPLLKTELDIVRLIESDAWMMEKLRHVATLHLPDWWIGAGFVRSKVWDTLHYFTERTPLTDVDVIYFDPSDIHEQTEKEIYAKLLALDCSVKWSTKNQARMHLKKGEEPYTSSTDALSQWTETPTCIGASLDTEGQVHLTIPHGVEDLLSCIVRPTPYVLAKPEIYRERMRTKNWPARWPQVRIIWPEEKS